MNILSEDLKEPKFSEEVFELSVMISEDVKNKFPLKYTLMKTRVTLACFHVCSSLSVDTIHFSVDNALNHFYLFYHKNWCE